jgi:membrane AbrB-like protein
MAIPRRAQALQVAETLLIAAAGGTLFNFVGFPAGWLAGAMVFSATAALAGRPIFLPHRLSRACFIALGISIGAVATPETLAGMATWPLSVVIVCVGMGVVTLGTVTYLKKVHGWDTLTAVFAGIPGGLSQVMALAAECKSDLRAIGIVQTMRVIILAVCVPGGLALFGLAGPARMPPGSLAIADAPGELLLLVGACVASAFGLLRLGFPGGLIFGPMVVSAFLHGAAIVHVTLPQWFANVAVIGLGAVAGSRFTGTPFRLVLQYMGAAVGAFVVALIIAAGCALLASTWLSLRISDLVVAYAPGSVDAMMILALALHLDPVFVGAHHLARLFTVTLALPLIVRYTAPGPRKTKSGRPVLPRADGLDD